VDVSPRQLLDQAKERFTVHDYFGCIHLLSNLVESGRVYADAYQLLGLAYHLAGEPQRALDAFDQAIALNPRYIEAYMHKGLVLNDLGREDEAAAAFVLAQHSGGPDRDGIPQHHAAKLANEHATLGDAYAEAGAMTPAIGQYKAALHLGPTFHDLRYRLARLLLEAGRSLEARDQLETVVAARPDSVEARAALGMACYVSGDRASAATIWSELEREHPDDIRVRAYLAMLRRAQSHPLT
jgi:tetratricopeptide (TPR) repeat protein